MLRSSVDWLCKTIQEKKNLLTIQEKKKMQKLHS